MTDVLTLLRIVHQSSGICDTDLIESAADERYFFQTASGSHATRCAAGLSKSASCRKGPDASRP